MGYINYVPLLFTKQMLRRNFLKKILISTIGIIAMSNKLFAKEIFSKPIFKDGIFYNNYIDHKMAPFKDFWKFNILVEEFDLFRSWNSKLALGNNPTTAPHNTLWLYKKGRQNPTAKLNLPNYI